MEVVHIQICVGDIEITAVDDGLLLTEFVKVFTHVWVPVMRCVFIKYMVEISLAGLDFMREISVNIVLRLTIHQFGSPISPSFDQSSERKY